MTPIDPHMSVCFECSRAKCGRCWRHGKLDLASYRPPPAAPPEPAAWTALWDEIERLRRELDQRHHESQSARFIRALADHISGPKVSPPTKRWERIFYRAVGHWPRSVVERRVASWEARYVDRDLSKWRDADHG